MFRVLVSDKIAKEGLAPLLESGQVEVVEQNVNDAPDLDTYDALLVRSATKVTEDVMDRMPKLKIIGRAGVGVDNIDVAAATRRGIIVVNAPDGNTIATAEHTFALMLAMVRKLCLANASMRRGEWNRSAFMGNELYGKTLGIIGFGRIGQEVAKRARAFEMNVLAYSRSLTPERAAQVGAKASSLEEILATADIITVHTPVTPETKGLLGEENLKKTKPGVMIINAARGGIVDEEALKRLLDSGHLAAAALDVYTQEPPADFQLMQMEQVTATPHIAASTKEAQLKVAHLVAEEVLAFAQGQPVKNKVN
ncbi:MAG: phosphoglycerate dehydrogenase [Firmicutes bacterium]|mgnify:CR=1 FL=1|nr:phosphoglycerate dehydrogenase [Bacillota bacterium]HBG08883.1 phosphoglycerate dehydrogenase [Bacillota bacterium]